MRDRDRISNLEELMAENLMRLDRLEQGQIELKNGQAVHQQSLLNLTQAVRTNSKDIEFLKENMSTKQMFANLFEAMVNGFDRIHLEMGSMKQDIEILKAR